MIVCAVAAVRPPYSSMMLLDSRLQFVAYCRCDSDRVFLYYLLILISEVLNDYQLKDKGTCSH